MINLVTMKSNTENSSYCALVFSLINEMLVKIMKENDQVIKIFNPSIIQCNEHLSNQNGIEADLRQVGYLNDHQVGKKDEQSVLLKKMKQVTKVLIPIMLQHVIPTSTTTNKPIATSKIEKKKTHIGVKTQVCVISEDSRESERNEKTGVHLQIFEKQYLCRS